MTSEHPNATAYRRTADAFRSRDQTQLEALIADEVLWHVPGAHPMAGDIRGRDALIAWLGELRSIGFWLTELDVFGNDEHVCALSVMGARREGVDVRTRVVSVFRYRNGQQVERWIHPADPIVWEQMFAGIRPAIEIGWHTTARGELRTLFELAEEPEVLGASLALGRVLVAQEAGSAVGHLQLVDSEADATREVKNMAVAESHQGRGIGRALMERAIAECRAEAVRTLLVATAAADTGNLRFYQRLGFRLLRVQRDAFTAAQGYRDGIVIDGIPLRDQVWLSQDL